MRDLHFLKQSRGIDDALLILALRGFAPVHARVGFHFSDLAQLLQFEREELLKELTSYEL
jgi:hypothetical protein